MLNVHLDRPADIVGILLYKRLELPYLEEGAVYLLLGIGLYVHDNVGADALLLAGGDGVAVSAAALPLDAHILAVLAGDDGDLVRDHKGRIEADAELTDNGQILALGLILVHLALEFERAALRDDAEVVFALLHRHADAVVAYGQGARFLIGDDVDLIIRTAHANVRVRQGQIAQLVYRVGRVGDDLTQEDLTVGVYGIDHQIEQALGFRLELFLTHMSMPPKL